MKSSPLLKWPGGKRSLLKQVLPLVPDSYNSYYEAFCGGGALFFAIQPSIAVLSDNNADLINCYVQVRDHPDEVIGYLSTLRNTKEDYYRIRSHIPTDQVAKAARLIYLTTLSFNGIHRLNLKGEFNVPYNHKTHVQPCDPAKIRAASLAFSSVEFLCADFGTAIASAKEGDVVYLDPPYTVAHGNNGFIKYNSRIFSWNDQIRLSNLARDIADRGCKVIVSNANHPSIIELYQGFQVQTVERASVIAATSRFRRSITECIFHNECE